MSKSKGPVAAYSDKDWKAHGDAEALMRAKEIQKDPRRLAAARGCLDELHTEHKDKMIAAKAAKTDGSIRKASGAFLKKSKQQPYG